jgi:glutamate transport system permease protein
VSTLLDNWDLFQRGFITTLQLLLLSGVLSVVLGTFLAALRVSPVPRCARPAPATSPCCGTRP